MKCILCVALLLAGCGGGAISETQVSATPMAASAPSPATIAIVSNPEAEAPAERRQYLQRASEKSNGQ